MGQIQDQIEARVNDEEPANMKETSSQGKDIQLNGSPGASIARIVPNFSTPAASRGMRVVLPAGEA